MSAAPSEITEVVSSILLIVGALSCLSGAVGIVTFPDVASRLQAATKPQTLGLILILAGTVPWLDLRNASALLLIALFQMLTAPVLSQIVGRAAYRSDSIRRDTLLVDDLADRLARERDADR